MGEARYTDLKKFMDDGYLQEVNRQFFHPLGLALSVTVGPNGEVIRLDGIFDYSDDPEGVVFTDLCLSDAARKAETFRNIQQKRHNSRFNRLGFIVQPIGMIAMRGA